MVFLLILDCCIEGNIGRSEINLPDKFETFFPALLAVPSAVFPFDSERSLVSVSVKDTDYAFKVNISMSEGIEVPAAAVISEGEIGAEKSASFASPQFDIFPVNRIDAVDEVFKEGLWTDALPEQMAWIEVDAEFFPVMENFQRSLCGVVVKSNLSRMDFQSEFDRIFLEGIKDRKPVFSYLPESFFDPFLRGLWIGVEISP